MEGLRVLARSAVLAVLVALVEPGAVRAQSPPNAQAKVVAEAKVAQARQLYERGDHEEALATLQAAYELYPSAKLHFNIGVVQRRLGREVEALKAFERFLAEASEVSAERRSTAQSEVVELRGRVGFIEVISDVDGAEILIDGTVHGKVPVRGPIVVTPGPHHVLVQKKDATVVFSDRIDPLPGVMVRIEARSATVTLSGGEAGAGVLVDGRAVGATPLPGPLRLDPGQHRFVIRKGTFETFERVITLSPGDRVNLIVELRAVNPASRLGVEVAVPQPAKPTSDAPSVYKRWWFWTAVAGVVVTAAVVTIAAGSRSPKRPSCPDGTVCVN